MASVLEINDTTFTTEVLDSPLLVLVDFWAPWCGPCRMVSPIVNDIASQYANQVKVLKFNVDDNSEIARQYGIRSIPTFMVFKGGQSVETMVGTTPPSTLATTLDKYL